MPKRKQSLTAEENTLVNQYVEAVHAGQSPNIAVLLGNIREARHDMIMDVVAQRLSQGPLNAKEVADLEETTTIAPTSAEPVSDLTTDEDQAVVTFLEEYLDGKNPSLQTLLDHVAPDRHAIVLKTLRILNIDQPTPRPNKSRRSA